MMRRPLWLGAGVALGVGGTLWAELRLRRWIKRLPAVLASLGPRGRTTELAKSALDSRGPGTAGTAVRPAERDGGAGRSGAAVALVAVPNAARRAATRAGLGLARAAIDGAMARREGVPAHR